MSATGTATQKWSQQDKSFGPGWADHYWQTQGLDSRGKVVEALHGFQWKTLVELGCNAGPMLARIKTEFPEAELGGIECNEVAVKAAQKQGLNVVVNDLMTWLPSCPPAEWDVILTHYTLAYISPEDLHAVLWQMKRIAKVGVVIAEPTGPQRMVYEYPEWAHPYPALLRRLGMKVSEIKVDEQSGHLNQVTVALL